MLASTTACSAVAADAPAGLDAYPEYGVTPGGTCRAIDATRFVGRPGTEALAREAQALAGAASFRWRGPGRIVTMDVRRDRLDIALDERGRVTGMRCG